MSRRRPCRGFISLYLDPLHRMVNVSEWISYVIGLLKNITPFTVTLAVFFALQFFCIAYCKVDSIHAMMATSWHVFILVLISQSAYHLIQSDKSTIKIIGDECENNHSLSYFVCLVFIVLCLFYHVKNWNAVILPHEYYSNVYGFRHIPLENHNAIRRVLICISIVFFIAMNIFKYQTISYTLSFYRGAGVYHVSNITHHMQGIRELCRIEGIGRNLTTSCEMKKLLETSPPSCYNQHTITVIIVCITLVFTQGVLAFFLCGSHLCRLWKILSQTVQTLCKAATIVCGFIGHYTGAFYAIPCNNTLSEFLIVIYCILLVVPVFAVGFVCIRHKAARTNDDYTDENMTLVIESFFTLFIFASIATVMREIQMIYHEFLNDFFNTFYMAGYTCMSDYQRMIAILQISTDFEWQNPPAILDLYKFNRNTNSKNDCVKNIFIDKFSTENALKVTSFAMVVTLFVWVYKQTRIPTYTLGLYLNFWIRNTTNIFCSPDEEFEELDPDYNGEDDESDDDDDDEDDESDDDDDEDDESNEDDD